MKDKVGAYKLTATELAKVIIVSSYILYLIDSLLDKSQKSKGSTIRLKQLLIAKTKVKNVTAMVELSNEAWALTIKQFSDNNMRIVIFDLVETLAFDNELILTELYGSKFMSYVCSFCLKQSNDIDSEILIESREVGKALKDNMNKILFDNKERI